MESSEETGYQAQEGPILCINNCGFFGSSTTMNMCSKCHKHMILKQQQTMLAAASIDNIVKNGSTSNGKAPLYADAVIEAECVELKQSLLSSENAEMKAKEGPTRCTSCFKRVGLTGFKCKCGEFFCSIHRYADKHACTFDYRAAGRDAIAKANPLVKAEKLDKI